jgi:hypothetical protein
VENENGTFSYYALAGWTGTDSFSMIGNDGCADSGPGGLTITVSNTAPTASNATLYTVHDSVLPGIDLNDYVDDEDGDPLQISIVSGPTHGDWTQNDDGTYIYTPDAEYVGSDTITFAANDGLEDSSTATLTMVVSQYAPSEDNIYTLIHDRTLEDVNFALNDEDALGDPWAIDIVIAPGHGDLTQNSDGTYDYVPDAHFYGTDTVTISANEGDDVVVTFEVTNHAPVIRSSDVAIDAYDQVFDGLDILAGARDSDDDSLSFEMVTEPSHGTLDFNSSTGLYDYHGDTGYVGMDEFSVRFFDGAHYSETSTVSILVYDDTLDSWDSLIADFAGAGGALYDGTPDRPQRSSIEQGNINNCWFVAAVASYVGVPTRSQWLKDNMIIWFADGTPRYTVRLPGATGFFGDQLSYAVNQGGFGNESSGFYSRCNGYWLELLQKAAGLYLTRNSLLTPPYQAINVAGLPRRGISLITGHAVDPDSFSYTSDDTTRSKLTAAYANNKVVTALSSWFTTAGIQGRHVYSVIGFNEAGHADEVHLRNPWGHNLGQHLDYWVQPPGQLGGPTLRHRGGVDGEYSDFWMPLIEFTDTFMSIAYEQ